MRLAAFPVVKTLDEFQIGASSVPTPTFDYLASLEWVRAAENTCLIGPAGTGKSHCETPGWVLTGVRTAGFAARSR